MSTTTLDVTAVRARFSALDRPLAFFDGPGGTQCPDEVIDAIADYLRDSNANIGAPYETSRRTDELVALSRERAAAFLGCSVEEVAFGPSMTALNFLLTRAFGRTLAEGDEIVVTKLDHDANVAPWLELAHDLGVVVRHAELTAELEVDYDHLRRLLSERTRVVAFPVAANSVGTAPDVAADRRPRARSGRARLGRRGALRAARADRRRRLGRGRPHLLAVQVLRAASRSRLRPARAHRVVAPVQGAPAPRTSRSATATSSARFRTSCSPGSWPRSTYVDSLGWDAILAHERALGERFLAGLPAGVELYGLGTMEGRVPTFCFNVPGRAPEEVATLPRRARSRGLARELLRARDDAAPRARGRRRAGGHRPLQHRGRGRPPARRARRRAVPDKDYSGTPLSQKLGAKPGAGVVVFFTTSRDDLERRFPALKATLDPADGLWVAWPKKAAKLEATSRSRRCRGSAWRTGSSTTSRRRSTSAGRGSASSTGSKIALEPRPNGPPTVERSSLDWHLYRVRPWDLSATDRVWSTVRPFRAERPARRPHSSGHVPQGPADSFRAPFVT